MQLHPRHAWDLTPPEAVARKERRRGEVAADRAIDLSNVRLVAGVDASMKNERPRAAVVVVTFPGFLVVETALAERPAPFPYRQGLPNPSRTRFGEA